MKAKTIREIALAWKSEKQRYVKQSTYAAYVLILENHLLSSFGDCEVLSEKLVQEFVLQKLNAGLSIKNGERYAHRIENGDEVWSEERLDELLRVGHQVPNHRGQQRNRSADGGTTQKDTRFIRQNFTFSQALASTSA